MNTEAQQLLSRAQARGAARAARSPRPDYQAVKPIFARQKSALTRAIRSKDPERVLLACRDVVRAWSEPPFDGAWPDDWARWQRALDTAFGFRSVQLEDLAE
jgi:hypothetical protein